MSKPKYNVKFVNKFYEDGEKIIINFSAEAADDVNRIVAALSAFYEGDPCSCKINGKKAKLYEDFGLEKELED